MCSHLGEWLGVGLLLMVVLYFAAFLYLHYFLKIEHKDVSIELGGDSVFGFFSPSYQFYLFRFVMGKRYLDLYNPRLNKLCEGTHKIALLFFCGLIGGYIFLQACGV